MNSENPNSEPARDLRAVRFQDAQAIYNMGQVKSKADAAAIAEMPETTFRQRMAGRRSTEDYGKTKRLLTAEEESVLL